MKNNKYKLLIIAALISMSCISCSDFLEVETIGRTTIPNFFSDMDGMRSATAGMYSETYNYYSSEFYKYPEVAGNMVDLRNPLESTEMINQYNFTSDPEQGTGAVFYIWRKIYSALVNTNNIIYYEPAVLKAYPANKAELEQIKAQALFIRALCHFDLCRVYAQPYNYTTDASHLGVPILVTTPSIDADLPRATVKEVYTQIISDLLESEKLFGTTAQVDAYHASKKSTQALLSRVYLYSGDWENAIKYSTEVINETTLSNGSDYLALYNNMIAGTEAIFRLNGTQKSKSLGQFYSSKTPVAVAADTLISLFDDPNDIRLKLFVIDPGSSVYFTRKYIIDVDYTTTTERYDPIVLRATEMYLNRAEAYLNANEPDKAAEDLKVVIARALGKEISEIAVDSSDKTVLAKLIAKERAKEFCFEGHNFFDIMRRNENLVRGRTTDSNVKFMAYPNDLFVLPIPQWEMDANVNMVGNPTVNN